MLGSDTAPVCLQYEAQEGGVRPKIVSEKRPRTMLFRISWSGDEVRIESYDETSTNMVGFAHLTYDN